MSCSKLDHRVVNVQSNQFAVGQASGQFISDVAGAAPDVNNFVEVPSTYSIMHVGGLIYQVRYINRQNQ